jgi:hypothetical protein
MIVQAHLVGYNHLRPTVDNNGNGVLTVSTAIIHALFLKTQRALPMRKGLASLHDLLHASLGSEGVALMQGMLQYRATTRFTAEACLKHAFMTAAGGGTQAPAADAETTTVSEAGTLCTMTAP